MNAMDQAKKATHLARENLTDIITEALCDRYRELTGKHPSDSQQKQIWYAVSEGT